MSLSEALIDDLADIGYSPDTYVAPPSFKVVPKGRYKMKLGRWSEDTDRNTGALRNPYTLLATFEIVEGPLEGRLLTYQRIKHIPFKTRVGASQLNDFIAVLAQATRTEGGVKGREAIKQLLDLARDTNATFTGRTDLEAYDKDYINGIKAEGRVPTNDDWNKARIEGSNNFSENGTVVGPSGTELSAQAVVKGFSL